MNCITSYYQHSQAGRGNLVAKLLEELGTSEKMEFDFALMKLPQWLGQTIKLEESELTKQKFEERAGVSLCKSSQTYWTILRTKNKYRLCG